jgi:hypothetical protein
MSNRTFTRDQLQDMYLQNLEEIKEKNTQRYVEGVKETIFRLNQQGVKQYTYNYHSQLREPVVVDEIARRLQEIFVDSEIVVHKADPNRSDPDRICVDWSNKEKDKEKEIEINIYKS